MCPPQLNIAGLGAASHMSLVSSAEEDDDDLKDEDAISVVHGISVASRSKEPKASKCACTYACK